jgi:AMP deaminase
LLADLHSNAHYLDIAENPITSELATLFQSLQKCLDLRDKYMIKSRQRLGDNPQDHDGHFPGLDDRIADVSGVRPDSDFRSNCPRPSVLQPWVVYPRPPPPHWHWTDKEKVVSADGKSARTHSEFVFEDCVIPEPHSWDFDIDDKGVFQVYENGQGERRLLEKHKIHLNVLDSQ